MYALYEEHVLNISCLLEKLREYALLSFNVSRDFLTTIHSHFYISRNMSSLVINDVFCSSVSSQSSPFYNFLLSSHFYIPYVCTRVSSLLFIYMSVSSSHLFSPTLFVFVSLSLSLSFSFISLSTCTPFILLLPHP